MSCDIFISYRRNGGWLMALNLWERLERAGYSAFIDRRMKRGRFDKQIYDRIDECKDFVLLLSPGALDECWSEESWVRKEIEFAVRKNKNIVPYVMKGFEMPQNLPATIVQAVMCQGAEESNAYFEASIQQLCSYLVSEPRHPEPADEAEDENVELEDETESSDKTHDSGSSIGWWNYLLGMLGLQSKEYETLPETVQKWNMRLGWLIGVLSIFAIIMIFGVGQGSEAPASVMTEEKTGISQQWYEVTLEFARNGVHCLEPLSDGDLFNVAAGDKLFVNADVGEQKGSVIRYYFVNFDDSDMEKEKLQDQCATANADSVIIKIPDEAPGSRLELWVSVTAEDGSESGWQRYYLNYQDPNGSQIWMRATLNGVVLQDNGRYSVKPGDSIHVTASSTEADIERIGYYFYTDQLGEITDVYADNITISVPDWEGEDKIYLYVEAIATNDNGEKNTITKTGWMCYQLLYK